MRKTLLALDTDILKPWFDGARVIGVSVSEYIERILEQLVRPFDAACCLEDAIRDRLYLTRGEAELAADRFELHSVDGRLEGHDLPVAVADVIEKGGGRWGVEVDVRFY